MKAIYLITVHKGKIQFLYLTEKENFMLTNQIKCINLNTQHVNGMTLLIESINLNAQHVNGKTLY